MAEQKRFKKKAALSKRKERAKKFRDET